MSAFIQGILTGRLTISLENVDGADIVTLHVEQTAKNIKTSVTLNVRQKDWDWITEQLYTELDKKL